jgi:hypothetical protein
MTKTIKDIEKEFDKEFPACNCHNGNFPPHFEDSKVNRDWVKSFYRHSILEILEGLKMKDKRSFATSGNGNFYIDDRNVTMEEFVKEKSLNQAISEFNKRIERAKK